jgi:alkylhydroperoxidase/carboxymuconolactone decarboxylase family protein YurZ
MSCPKEPTMPDAPDREALKRKFLEERGYWSPYWEGLLKVSPGYFEAAMNLWSIPVKKGPLEPKVREFILIAVNASVTHMYEPALRVHIQNALRYGATEEELVEVLQLTSILGVHALSMGVPTLLDELYDLGKGDEIAEMLKDPERQEIKAEFIRLRGYWNDFWNGLLAIDPEFFRSYLQYSLAGQKGPLEPKVEEFIYIAIDAAATHLYEPGLRVHYRKALGYGATKEEIMQVLQLTSELGMQTSTMGLPILLDEIERARQAR